MQDNCLSWNGPPFVCVFPLRVSKYFYCAPNMLEYETNPNGKDKKTKILKGNVVI